MRCFLKKALVFAILCGIAVARNYDPDRLVFPDAIEDRNEKSMPDVQPAGAVGERGIESPMSVQLAKKISSLSSVEEFLNFMQGYSTDGSLFLSSRIGETGERSNGEVAKPAGCTPYLQPVSLEENEDPSTRIYPPCTPVKRCGGCCWHKLLSCQPTEVIVRNFEATVVTIQNDRPIMRNKIIVPIEEHTKCQCGCRIKKEDCNDKQEYNPDECICKCNNTDDQEKCQKDSRKYWDPNRCVCVCIDQFECSTGSYFDRNTCRCVQRPLTRNRIATTKGGNYGLDTTQRPGIPPVFIALDPMDPRRKPKPDPESK